MIRTLWVLLVVVCSLQTVWAGESRFRITVGLVGQDTLQSREVHMLTKTSEESSIFFNDFYERVVEPYFFDEGFWFTVDEPRKESWGITYGTYGRFFPGDTFPLFTSRSAERLQRGRLTGTMSLGTAFYRAAYIELQLEQGPWQGIKIASRDEFVSFEQIVFLGSFSAGDNWFRARGSRNQTDETQERYAGTRDVKVVFSWQTRERFVNLIPQVGLGIRILEEHVDTTTQLYRLSSFDPEEFPPAGGDLRRAIGNSVTDETTRRQYGMVWTLGVRAESELSPHLGCWISGQRNFATSRVVSAETVVGPVSLAIHPAPFTISFGLSFRP